ncbi:hypothetical protein ABG067_008432, partial [Albugo candida]
MVLPNSQPTQRSDRNNNLSDTQPQPNSYVNVVKGKIKQSLLHSDAEVKHPDENDPLVTFQSRIFRSSRTKGAYLFDISRCYPHFTEKQVMQICKMQHPNSHSCIALKDGNTKYLEVYVDKEDDSNGIAGSGLTFTKTKFRILPCPAANDATKVVNVKLSNLPLLKKEKVLLGLKTSLAPFGKLLDVGIYVDKETRYFMGNGYAILD